MSLHNTLGGFFPLEFGFAAIFVGSWLIVGYVVYHRLFHPLAQFPGPILASLTNLWKPYQFLSGKYEHVLRDLHRKHGKIVHIGPNYLDKSTFYDAFTALRPNLFGARDEEVHAARRKAVANGFSAQSIAAMEIYMDSCMNKLIQRLDDAAGIHEAINLKTWIGFFVMDVLGELAFSRSFGVLSSGDESRMPPIKEHVLLAMISGQTPWIVPYVNRIVPYLPIPSLRRMLEGRNGLRQMAVASVQDRIVMASLERKDLLGRLLTELRTGNDSKGQHLDVVDVQIEAFGFIIAGSHTTAASTTLLFWHLLHNPTILAKLQKDIDGLPEPGHAQRSYPFNSTNQSQYLQATISEGFRINPVFTMPLMRAVPDGGKHIAGAYFPAGTDLSICNHVIHHDESVFGLNLEKFVPDRWLNADYDKLAYLIPFGSGHRACIGRTIAITEIQKMIVSLLARYEMTPVGQDPATRGAMPPTHSFGVAELELDLMVKLKVRFPLA